MGYCPLYKCQSNAWLNTTRNIKLGMSSQDNPLTIRRYTLYILDSNNHVETTSINYRQISISWCGWWSHADTPVKWETITADGTRFSWSNFNFSYTSNFHFEITFLQRHSVSLGVWWCDGFEPRGPFLLAGINFRLGMDMLLFDQ